MKVRERPILFSGDMVRAILAGTKTQTRRVVKQRSKCPKFYNQTEANQALIVGEICPYGQVGDRLWVRETFATLTTVESTCKKDIGKRRAIYGASPPPEIPFKIKWRPSIHMPRWASRITLEITSVRVERLQDISIQDAIDEGMQGGVGAVRHEFGKLWESINGADSLNSNPWVWVIEFKQVK